MTHTNNNKNLVGIIIINKNDSDMNFILLQRRFDACNKIKFISLSFLSKLFSQKILIIIIAQNLGVAFFA